MEWIVRFVAVWLLFILLVDLKRLKTNIFCGLFSIALQTAIDTVYISHGYYKITDPVISIFGSSLFFIIGPVLVIGILLAQFHPTKKWMQLLYVILLSGINDIEELLLIYRKALVYINWDLLASAVINLIIMICLSWFTVLFLKRGEALK